MKIDSKVKTIHCSPNIFANELSLDLLNAFTHQSFDNVKIQLAYFRLNYLKIGEQARLKLKEYVALKRSAKQEAFGGSS